MANKVGTMLPCNVVMQERESGHCEVTVIGPSPIRLSRGPPNGCARSSDRRSRGFDRIGQLSLTLEEGRLWVE